MSKRPNLLYIHSDQHTPNVLGCYGDPLVQTPNLDALAESGAMFTNVYAPSPICTPSRMSTLTGRHPYKNECWTNYHVLNSGIPTFAHAMGAGGYRPILFGRMHSIGPDQLHGYAERYIGDHCSNYTDSLDVDHGELQGAPFPKRESLLKSGSGQNAYQVHDEDVTASAVSYINETLAKSDDDEPFCLTVGYMLPHQPYVAKKEDYDLYKDKITMPKIQVPFSDDLHPHIREWRRDKDIEEVSEEEIKRARAAYWGLVTRTDKMIGEVIQALKDNGLYENTIVIYSSDHGDQVGEHSLWWKMTFYENSVKVPLIVSWPGKIDAGQKIDKIVSSLDLSATMLDLMDCPQIPNSQGSSLVPVMRGEDNLDDTVFSEFCNHKGMIHRMIRKGDFKFNYYHGLPSQLFNMNEDPDELNDLIDSPDHQEIANSLKEELLKDWNPDAINEEIARKYQDYLMVEGWAHNTNPVDQYYWKLDPTMDYLDK